MFHNITIWNQTFKCRQRKVAINKGRASHTDKFDTHLWWETGEFAETAGSPSGGCKTNAFATEEPRSIIMTMKAKDMVLEPGRQSKDELDRGLRRRLVLCVWLDEETGVTRQWCCTRYCLSGPGNAAFYLPVSQLGLEILNIVVTSRVNEYKRMIMQTETNRMEWKVEEKQKQNKKEWYSP